MPTFTSALTGELSNDCVTPYIPLNNLVKVITTVTFITLTISTSLRHMSNQLPGSGDNSSMSSVVLGRVGYHTHVWRKWMNIIGPAILCCVGFPSVALLAALSSLFNFLTTFFIFSFDDLEDVDVLNS